MSNSILDDLSKIEFSDLNDLIINENKQMFANVDIWFNEINDGYKQIEVLQNVKTAIETHGVTDDIIENNKSVMWDMFEYDLEAFKNATRQQTSFCIESLGTTIANIIRRIINAVDKIIDFFMIDSGFAIYMNRMETYRIMINTKLIKLKDYATFLDIKKCNNTVIVNIPRDIFIAYRTALANICSKIISNGSKILTIAEMKSAFQSDLSSLMASIEDNGSIKNLITNSPTRRDVLISLKWNILSCIAEGRALSDTVLQTNPKLYRLKHDFTRSMRQFRVTLVDILEGRTTPQVQASVETKNGCLAMKNLIEYISNRSSGMAFLWSNMVGVLMNECKKFG